MQRTRKLRVGLACFPVRFGTFGSPRDTVGNGRMWKHTTTDRDGLMDVTEIDLRGLRMSPDGVTAALATMPPP